MVLSKIISHVASEVEPAWHDFGLQCTDGGAWVAEILLEVHTGRIHMYLVDSVTMILKLPRWRLRFRKTRVSESSIHDWSQEHHRHVPLARRAFAMPRSPRTTVCSSSDKKMFLAAGFRLGPYAVCVCIYLYVYTHICIYEFVCICVYSCMYARTYVCIHTHIGICIHLCVHICMYVHTHMYIRIWYPPPPGPTLLSLLT